MNIKGRSIAIFLLLCLLMGSALCAVSCERGGEDNKNPDGNGNEGGNGGQGGDGEGGSADYKITVQDFEGKPAEGVIVKIFKGDEQIKMNLVNGEGSVTFTLDKGDYTFTVDSPEGTKYYYDTELCKLSAVETEVTVKLYNSAVGSIELSAISPVTGKSADYLAYEAGEGGTFASLTKNEMTYFVFTPTRGGVYEFGYESDEELEIGYYGGVFFVQPINQAENLKDGKFTLNVKDSSVSTGSGGTVSYVIGVRNRLDSQVGCVLTITRKGDAEVDIYDAPWTDVRPTDGVLSTEFVEYAKNEGEFTPFDVTDNTLKAVFSEADGCYHLGSENGALIYVRLGEDSEYLASFLTICDTTRVGYYVYNEDGSFSHKESYNALIADYIEAHGNRVPLTKQLADMIVNYGKTQYWWNLTPENIVFGEKVAEVVPENAWLFACGYYAD
ncbi:MAG: hypothetical protein IJY04_08830 [Clostridia bacterium]|nr:hypothetical protein [Clostridia bacterium]